MTLKKSIFLLFLFSVGCYQSIFSQKSAEDYINIIENEMDESIKFNALDSLIFALKWDDDPKIYANYTDVYIDLAIKKSKYKEAINAATFAAGIINTKLGDPNRTLKMLNKVEVYKDSVGRIREVGMMYLKKGGAYFNGKDFSKAISNYEKSVKAFTNKDSIYIADAIFFTGQAHFSTGNYVEAINKFNIAYEYYKLLADQQYMFYAKANTINTYGANGFHDKTVNERNNLIKEKLSVGYYDGLEDDYYNQSINYGKLGEKERQEQALLKAVEYLEKNKDSYNYKGNYIIIHSGLARFYMDNNMSLAETYLINAKNMSLQLKGETQGKLFFQLTNANYLFLRNNLNQAEKLATETLLQAKSWGNTSLIIEVNDLLFRINQKRKNFKKALEYYNAKIVVQDSIFNKEKTNAFSYYQTLYETERKESEIKEKQANINFLESEKSIEKARTKALLFIIASLIILTVFVIYFLRQRAKQLQQKLKFNKDELTAYTKALLLKSREHDLLKEELKGLKAEKVSDKKLDKLQDLISSKILTSEDWTEFKNKFEKVYPNFLIKARLNNNLTNAEERLLTLEKLNLKTSEIADVLGVSNESVTKNRYRLRKKLGISKQTPITDIAEH